MATSPYCPPELPYWIPCQTAGSCDKVDPGGACLGACASSSDLSQSYEWMEVCSNAPQPACRPASQCRCPAGMSPITFPGLPNCAVCANADETAGAYCQPEGDDAALYVVGGAALAVLIGVAVSRARRPGRRAA